jgi:hypothetical protein
MAKVLITATVSTLSLFAAPLVVLDAAELTEAQVTRIIREVQVLPEHAAPRPATLQDIVRGGTAVRTGIESRTELTFPDQTLARLGANTLFSFNSGTRALDLGGGAMLLHVPKGQGGAKILTAAVTAAITGTTVLIEYHPPEHTRGGKDFSKPVAGGGNVAFGLVTRDPAPGDLSSNYIKFITLEGVARIYIKGQGGRPILVPAGKMLVVAPDGSWSNVFDVNLEVLVRTSPLITDFPPLPSYPQILEEIERQREAEIAGGLIDTNIVNYGWRRPVSLRDPQQIDTIDQRFSGPGIPTATPSKFGKPPVIAMSNPYIIDSETTIGTDPAITRNGITSFGKIYRRPARDGSFSAWAFRSTSAFDMGTGIDDTFSGGGTVPLAAFKFEALQLAGNPVINTAGGAMNLALISVGNLSDAVPGGTLTFTGINTLLLATEDGAINFSSNISFSNLNQLIFYARGAGSNLTLDSAVSGVRTVRLDAEGSILVNGTENVNTFNAFAGVDFLQGTGQVTAPNVSIRAGNDLNLALSRFAVAPGVTTDVSLQAGANVNINANTNQSLFTNASLLTINSGGGINIAGFASDGPLTLRFANSAVVVLSAGAGGINAPTINLIHPGFGLTLASGGDIVFNAINGANTIQAPRGDVSTNQDLIANTVVAGGTVTADGDLTAFSSITAGGPITVMGTLLSPSATAGADITAGHIELQNATTPANLIAGSGGITPYIPANGSSLLHMFAVATVVSPNGIDFSGNNFPTAGSSGGVLGIDAVSQVFGAGGIQNANFNGGDPGGDGGTLTVNASGNISLFGTTIAATTGISGALAGAGGTVNLTSTNGQVSVNSSTILVSSDDVSAGTNRRFSASGGKINIRSNATTGVAINIASSSQLLSLLDGAAPGPGGLITVMATGANSSANVSGRVRADGGAVDIRHTGAAGTVNLGDPTIQADIVKVAALGTNGVLNINGGIFSAGMMLKLYAPGSNGQINFLANCRLTGGQMNIIAGDTVTIANNVMVTTVGTAAHVFTNRANYSGFGGNGTTTGTFGGLGALPPQPLSAAPPLGPPGGP